MKVDLIRKFKWYIVGFILVAIMLSVSLSFSAWDTLSFKALMNANGGDFKEKSDAKYVLVDDLYLSDGTKVENGNGNSIADVGDIVTFGNYYQTASTDPNTKTPIRWIVVDITNRQDGQGKQLALLTEKVMVFGSFWGTYYHNGSGLGHGPNSSWCQNYSQSTVRAWLNSSARNDDGTAISSDSPQGVQFKGFMSEAFTPDEQSYILSKTISGMKGGVKDTSSINEYATVTDKVWLPSYSEIYGNNALTWSSWSDGSPNDQFSYFASGNSKVGSTTAFASSQYSNYTMLGATHSANYQGTSAGGNVWWWLRSPHPSNYTLTLFVHMRGIPFQGGTAATDRLDGGVRPAVCVQL